MHDLLKERVGIAIANCESCLYLGSDGDGNYSEMEVTWPVCDKIAHMGNLKSFPFKKEMKCWEPNFWASKFADMIKTGTDEEMEKAVTAFLKAKKEIYNE